MELKQFDDVFEYIGGFGVFQICLFLILGLVCYLNAFHVLGMTMLGENMDHWCKIDRLSDFSHDQQKYIAIPKNKEDDVYSQCYMYDLDYENFTDEELWGWNRSSISPDTEQIKCNSWTYDQSVFTTNAVSRFDLVCDHSNLLPMTSSIFQIGILVGAPLSGYLSDRFGRKPVLNFGVVGFLVTSILVTFAPSYWSFTAIRFILSVFQHIGFLCAFVIILEITGKSSRTIVGCLYHGLFSLGGMTVPITGYFIRDYTNLCICWAIPVSVCLLYFVLAPESPRWLVAIGKYTEAERILEDIAETNGRKMPAMLHFKPQNMVKEIIQETEHSNGCGQAKSLEKQEEVSLKFVSPKAETLLDVIRSSILRKELFIIYIGWFANNLLYYGLSLNAGSLPGSVFLNAFLMSGIEVPAVIVCVLTLFYVGRRPSLAYGLLAAAAANLLCIPFIGNPDFGSLVTTLSLFGKGCIKLSFVTIYIYTGELFPTPVRHIAIGSSSMISKIGGVLAPFMGETLIQIWQPLPSLIFGLMALLTGILSLWLPETMNRPLPDTIKDAEQLARGERSTAIGIVKETTLNKDTHKDVHTEYNLNSKEECSYL